MPIQLYEITLNGSFADQDVINVWNYAQSNPTLTGSADNLRSLFGALTPPSVIFNSGTVLAAYQLAVNPAYTFISLFVRNVYDPTDFSEFVMPTGVIGEAVTGVAQPPFMAYPFRGTRTRLDIRRFFKRIPAVGKDVVGTEGAIEPTFATNVLVPLADAMEATLTGGTGIPYQPVVVKKQRYTTPSGSTAYRYIPDADGGVAAQLEDTTGVGQIGISGFITTQNSRKRNKGT